MTKHVIQVNDGDIVELVPQDADASTSTTEDAAGFAAMLQSLPGAPADASRRKGVIISCPPLPGPPVMLQGEDVQGFLTNNDSMGGTANQGGGSGGYGAYTAGVATGIVLAIAFL